MRTTNKKQHITQINIIHTLNTDLACGDMVIAIYMCVNIKNSDK